MMKTKNDFINLVRSLISENRIEDTLNLIEKYANENRDTLTALTLIRSRCKNSNSSFFIYNLIKREDYQVDLNRINKAILELVNEAISEKTRFEETDWRDLLGQNESIRKDFLNPKLQINDEQYKRKIVTVIEYLLKRSVDKTFDAFELCTFTIENVNSTIPHAYEYRALCNFILTPIETIIEQKDTVKIIEDLDFATKLGKSENHDKIAEFIGYSLKATLSSLINRLKKELKQVEKSDIPSKRLEILNYILAYNKICYHIYPSISFKKAIVEELCGQNELAWLNFANFCLCNDTFELTNNMDEVSFSILEYISDQIKLIQQIEPQYQPPLLKIGRVLSEPELITDILKRNRLICGIFLIFFIFLLSSHVSLIL